MDWNKLERMYSSKRNFSHYYRKQKMWKKNHNMTDEAQLRGNKKWCEKYGEDLTLPRFIGDRKVYIVDGKHYYPPYEI